MNLCRNVRTYLVPAWFSMRYQVAEKFSLVKSPLIPGKVTSRSFCGTLPLGNKSSKQQQLIIVCQM